MIINDKIRDKKLQNNINREAAKILVSSSGYQYHTGEEILSSNQRRTSSVENVYSPLGKALVKQTKMIECQGEKQIKTLEENGKQLQNKKQPGNDDQVLLSKEREIFKNIYNKRLDKIDELSKKLNYGDLKFIVDSANLETDFSELKDPVVSVDSTEKRIEKARYKQEEFNRYLKEI